MPENCVVVLLLCIVGSWWLLETGNWLCVVVWVVVGGVAVAVAVGAVVVVSDVVIQQGDHVNIPGDSWCNCCVLCVLLLLLLSRVSGGHCECPQEPTS